MQEEVLRTFEITKTKSELPQFSLAKSFILFTEFFVVLAYDMCKQESSGDTAQTYL